MEKKIVVVAISKDGNQVLKVRNCTKEEYNAYLEKEIKHDQEKRKEINDILNHIGALEQKCKELEHEIKVLKGEE